MYRKCLDLTRQAMHLLDDLASLQVSQGGIHISPGNYYCERRKPCASEAYLPPETAADVPTEFVSVTETVPITPVSPLNVNGTVSENAPPFVTPASLLNHVSASALNGTLQGEHPLSCVPEAALNTNAPLVRSRGVDVASRNT